MVVDVLLVIANRGQPFYSARGKRKLRQEDNAPSPSFEAFSEYTNVTGPEAVGILSPKDRIFIYNKVPYPFLTKRPYRVLLL